MKKYLRYIFIFFLTFLFIFNVNAQEFPNISSKNVIFIDMDNDNIIYEKSKDDKVLIASLTKIMTALITIENVDNLDEKIVVTSDMISGIGYDYTKVGFKVGDVISYKDVVYGILLKSGADATNIAAISTKGSIEEFVKLMNEKAKKIGMDNTNFTNTIGIDNENHYSTAKDLSMLLNYAYKNEKFKEIFTSESYISSDLKYNMDGPLKYIHNDVFKMDYVKGAKTGYTKAAGHCLASVANYKNNNFILIVIGNDIDDKKEYFIDSKNIYEYYFNNYDYRKILNKGDVILKLKTQYDENIEIKSKESVIRYLDKSLDLDDLEYVFDGNKILKKGIKKNDFIGNFYIKNNGKILYETKVYSKNTVNITFDYFINHNRNLLIVLTILIMFLILSVHNLRKNRKNNRR